MKKTSLEQKNSGACSQTVARQRSCMQYQQPELLTASRERVPGASSPIVPATTGSEHAGRIIGNGAAAAR